MREGLQETSSVQTQKGWYHRGYLPHIDLPHFTQFVTFRLADSIPQNLWEQWNREIGRLPEPEQRRQREILCNRYSDQGYGECLLRDPQIGEIVERSLLYFHGQDFDLLEWTIMPNHVHFLARFGERRSLPATIKTIKGFSAKEANICLGRKGSFWARDYFDRYIRNGEHFANVVRYIDHNAVKAGLCDAPEKWPLGSARFRSLADKNVGGPSQN